jgi:alpha-1,6-mannosyltransferase
MKICDVTNFYSPRSGGVKTYINHKREYIARRSDQYSHLLVVPGEETRKEVNGNLETLYVRSPMWKYEANYRVCVNITEVAEHLAREQVDVIEVGSPYFLPWACRGVAEHYKIPLIGFFHSNFVETYVRRGMEKWGPLVCGVSCWASWGMARLIYSFCDRVIVTSSHAEADLHRNKIMHTTRIPFGVDTEYFSPKKRSEELRESFGVNPDQQLLLYVGRLSPEKNLQALGDAFLKLEDRYPDRFALMFVGSGPSLPDVEQMCADHGNICYAGYQTIDTGLADLYASADIFVQPSPNETFGLSPMEALASGLPVIAVHGGAVKEILPDFGHKLAQPYNPEDLANTILAMSNEMYPEIHADIRRYSLNYCSWERTYDRIFDLYHSIYEEKQRRPYWHED